jgi:hypothetical protein
MNKPVPPIDPDSRLRDSAERGVSMDWPLAISERLDALVELAEDEGENTSRKELTAALLLAAPEIGEELSVLLKTYRRALARDALLSPDSAGDVIKFEQRKPGRRPRRSA